MEMVAMDMKLRGMYIARQLSFKGVSFKIEEIPIDKEYIKVYNEAVALVCHHFSYLLYERKLKTHTHTKLFLCNRGNVHYLSETAFFQNQPFLKHLKENLTVLSFCMPKVLKSAPPP